MEPAVAWLFEQTRGGHTVYLDARARKLLRTALHNKGDKGTWGSLTPPPSLSLHPLAEALALTERRKPYPRPASSTPPWSDRRRHDLDQLDSARHEA